MSLYNSPKVRSLRQEVAFSSASDTDGTDSSASYTYSRGNRGASSTESVQDWIKKGAISTAHQTAAVLQRFRKVYGLKIATPHLTQGPAISSLVLLEDLPRKNQPPRHGLDTQWEFSTTDGSVTWNSELAFEETFRCLLAIGTQALLPRGIARMVYRTAEQMDIRLPVRITQMMKIAADLTWQPRDLLRMNSRYPNVAIMDGSGKRGTEVRMAPLLKKWEKMDLEDQAVIDVENAEV